MRPVGTTITGGTGRLKRLAALLLTLPVAALAQGDHTHPPAGAANSRSGADGHISAAANDAMAGSMIMSAHVRMTPSRSATTADSARASTLLQKMHRALDKYRNVRVAEADGFRQFLPNIPQPIYHFTNFRWSLAEVFRFDPTRPTSLLYRKESNGDFTLTGAMYTARRNASPDDLDGRVPLGISRWHQHVNWCVPQKGDEVRWRETRDGNPLFGPRSPVSTREQCDAIRGVFHPTVFGWMVHVNAWASDDPALIWGSGHEH